MSDDVAGKTVLHVDDSAESRKVVSEILEKMELEVIEAQNGLEAIELLNEQAVDLVLTDLQMPAMHGHELIEKLGNLFPSLPVVVVAAPGTAEDVLTALGSRACGYITKPFTAEELLSVVLDTLRGEAADAGIQVVSATESWIELSFPNRSSYIVRVREFFNNLEVGVEESERSNLLYSFTELAQNAIEHGNRMSPNTRVTMAWYRLPGMRVFRVRDQGSGFDPRDLDHAVAFNDEADPREIMRKRMDEGIRPGGLGIASALRLSDELIYNERGNEVIMIKQVTESDSLWEEPDTGP